MTRGHFLRALIGAITAFSAGVATAQAYPEKPIRLVVPFAAGGSVDTVARLIATKLRDRLQQQMVVDNRGGAGGNIGTQAVVSAPADGYTLLWGVASNIAINPSPFTPPRPRWWRGCGSALWPRPLPATLPAVRPYAIST